MSSTYTTTYTTFGGADFIPRIGNKPVYELTDVQYTENLSTGLIEGVFTVTVFPDACMLSDKAKEKFDMTFVFANEYGQRKVEFLKGITLTKRNYKIGVDSIVEEEKFSFEADKFIRFENYETSISKQLAFIQENLESKDFKTQALVDFYKSEIARVVEQSPSLVIKMLLNGE